MLLRLTSRAPSTVCRSTSCTSLASSLRFSLPLTSVSVASSCRNHRHFSTPTPAKKSATPSQATTSAAVSSSNTHSDLTAEWMDLFSDVDATTSSSSSSSESEVTQSTGEVLSLSYGIVSIDGLRSAHSGACVEFMSPSSSDSLDSTSSAAGGEITAIGLVLSIHQHQCRVLIISGDAEIRIGQQVRHTKGHVPALTQKRIRELTEDGAGGKIIDALGRELDEHTLQPLIARLPKQVFVDTEASLSAYPILTHPPPSLSSRSTKHPFIPTGLIQIDAFHPLAQGLKVGVMGVKRSGKTQLCTKIVENVVRERKNATVEKNGTQTSVLSLPEHFIYVAMGQSRSDIRSLIDRLKLSGSFEHTTLVVATQDDTMGAQYLAPFTGATLSDALRDEGRSNMIIYDDLSAHGQVLATVNRLYGTLILPVNLVHAKLLERVAPVRTDDPAAPICSSTALIVVETGRTDRHMNINENLAGFVDHVIRLDPTLAAANMTPPINVASVLGRPSARYRPHVLRELSNRLSTLLLQSERKVNTAKWAHEFGLVTEEEDVPLVEYKEKVQHALTQDYSSISRLDTLSITDHMVLMYALLYGETDRLSMISLGNIEKWRSELFGLLKGDVDQKVMSEYRAFYQELEREVEKHAREDGNSTEGSARTTEENAKLALPSLVSELTTGDAGSESGGQYLPHRAPKSSLFARLDEILETFNKEFRRKYE